MKERGSLRKEEMWHRDQLMCAVSYMGVGKEGKMDRLYWKWWQPKPEGGFF